MDNLIITGNLTKDPVKYETNGDIRVRFTIANNDDKEKPLFLDCVAFKRLAENCLTYLLKGSKVLVRGRLQVYESEKDGRTYKNVETLCDQVEFLSPKNDRSDLPFPDLPPREKPKTDLSKLAQKKEEPKIEDDSLPF